MRWTQRPWPTRKKALEKACGGAVFAISGVSNQGLTEVLRALYAEVVAGREVKVEDGPWQP